MPAQFLRDEAFSNSPISREGQKTRWSLESVVAEAERDPSNPGAIRHVGVLRQPIFLTAERPSDVAARAIETSESCREYGTGKRIRKSANILVSRVMSYPVACSEFGDLSQLEQEIRSGLSRKKIDRPDVQKLNAWIVASVRWSRQDLGDRGAVVLHLDEAHPHIHHLVPIRERTDRPGVADLSFWKPARAASKVREDAREAGIPHRGRDIISVGRETRKAIAADYQRTVGSIFDHSLTTDEPRKRRNRRDHLELEKQRERAERAEEEAVELRTRLSLAETENVKLKARIALLLDQGRALAARARTWIQAMRGEPDAVRDASEEPTLTQKRIDAVLGTSQKDIPRIRVTSK